MGFLGSSIFILGSFKARNPMSKSALCATIGVSPIKFKKAGMTSLNEGDQSSSPAVNPVKSDILSGIGFVGLIKDVNWSIFSPLRKRAAPTSIMSLDEGSRPVVSRSIDTNSGK